MKDIEKNLIAQSSKLEEIDEKVTALSDEITAENADLNELKKRSKKIKQLFPESNLPKKPIPKTKTEKIKNTINKTNDLDYDEVLSKNLIYLEKKGLQDEKLDGLFSKDDLLKIERELSQPIQREKWDRWDYVTVFTAATSGAIADHFTKGIDNNLSNWLDGFKIETPKVAIDYQGPGFGGRYHRGMSSGHNILRIFSAIWQIKNGTFTGLKQTPNGFEWVETTVNQYGNNFDTYSGFEAFLIWMKHHLSDFVTPDSLPFPGMSFLMELPDHEIRKFAIQMYSHGYNLRFILVQALSPALVEIITRGYVMGREYKEFGEIKFPSAKRLKLTELLLTGHLLVTAVNAGKVIIQCNAEGPLALRNLNIPSIIATIRYLIPFVYKRIKLNDPVEIIKRNAKDIVTGYDSIIDQLSYEITEDNEFQEFISDGKTLFI